MLHLTFHQEKAATEYNIPNFISKMLPYDAFRKKSRERRQELAVESQPGSLSDPRQGYKNCILQSLSPGLKPGWNSYVEWHLLWACQLYYLAKVSPVRHFRDDRNEPSCIVVRAYMNLQGSWNTDPEGSHCRSINRMDCQREESMLSAVLQSHFPVVLWQRSNVCEREIHMLLYSSRCLQPPQQTRPGLISAAYRQFSSLPSSMHYGRPKTSPICHTARTLQAHPPRSQVKHGNS